MKVLVSLLGVLVLTSNLMAQKAQLSKMDKDATILANELCTCTEEVIMGYHPGIQALFKDMMLLGEEVAQKNFEIYYNSVSQIEQEKIALDIQKMDDFENVYRVKCTDPLDAKYVNYAGNTVFEEKLKANLKDLKECTFTYQLMLLGEQK